MLTNTLLSIIVLIVGPVIIASLGVVFGLLYLGVDRKLVAHMQGRIGPPIIQPFRDVDKLFMKESIIPDSAISWLFKGAPILCMIGTTAMLLYIPLFGQNAMLTGFGDAIVVMYLITIPSLAMVIGGFASSSPYATVGAQREMVMMMSYELPLAMVIVLIAWRIGFVTNANPFMLSTMAAYPIWNLVGPLGAVGFLILLIVMLVVTPGELGRIPFDVAEAETELAGGLLVEYSGRNLALFYVSSAVKSFAIVALIVGLFFPYSLSPLLGISATIPAVIVNLLFFLVKVFVIMFICVMLIRSALARFKIDQASKFYIWVLGAISVLGMALIILDVII